MAELAVNSDICTMNILVVAATSFEIQPAIDFLQSRQFHIDENEFSVLLTGIGGIATTYNLVKTLTEKRTDFVLQAGIAGSFHQQQPIGSVVWVSEELMADLGAEEEDGFRDVFDLGLVKENQFPFDGKILKNPYTEKIKNNDRFVLVRSISINEVTTRKDRIALIRKKYNPDIESMEGAALHYVCLREKIPFLQVRAISNYVGERNKENWSIKLAIENLNSRLIDIIGDVAWRF
jgi:futalosine hydrolase